MDIKLLHHINTETSENRLDIHNKRLYAQGLGKASLRLRNSPCDSRCPANGHQVGMYDLTLASPTDDY